MTSENKSRRPLPPGQHSVKAILRWNIDHPGITRKNPVISRDQWTLNVSGEVENQVKLLWNDFLALPAAESVSDFHCVEGWSVLDCRWYGVKFQTMASLAQPKVTAKYVLFKCADGYTTCLPLQDLFSDDVLLAYKLNGEDLPIPLGGPMRLVVPAKYAYKSALWVIEIVFKQERELGFWEKRGYSDTADVWMNDRYSTHRF